VPDVVMPRLSDSMEEGTIIRWLVEDGSHVTSGTEMVEIESDKAVVVYAAEDAGVLTINAAEGGTFPVGALIARVASAGEQVPAFDGSGTTVVSTLDGRGGKPEMVDQAVPLLETAPSASVSSPGMRPKASPIARRIASERGIDLTVLTGTGPNGRIVREDVETHGHRLVDSHATPVSAGVGDESTRTLTRVQQMIARRMTEAKATCPSFLCR
jgi:pyruvate dehydrogenase E2 component (dihydrolipoamide acetyltransferase)